MKQISGKSLIIKNVSKSQRGRYRCEVSGQRNGPETTLDVKYAPRLKELEDDGSTSMNGN